MNYSQHYQTTPAQQLLAQAPRVTPDHWSKQLEHPTTDVLMYEQLIRRDSAGAAAAAREKTQSRERVAGLARGLQYYSAVRTQRLHAINQVRSGIWGDGYAGYGNGTSNNRTHTLVPARRKRAGRAPEWYVLPAATKEQASSGREELVPVRLEFEVERDKFKLADTFLWNLHESTMLVPQFAAQLMDDMRMPAHHHHTAEAIVLLIQEQLDDFHAGAESSLPTLAPSGVSSVASTPGPVTVRRDLRVPIFLDITVGNNQLKDTFEWDLGCAENDPEEFATTMCAEMALSGEFATAIAHTIREQAQWYTKSLFLVGYKFDGLEVGDEELRRRFLSPDLALVVRLRSFVNDYAPVLLDVTNVELERLEKDRERELRRKRRQGGRGRRGGPQLPDLSDLPKTFRTPVPSTILPGALDLGPPVDGTVVYEERFEEPNPDFGRQLVLVDHDRGYLCMVRIRFRSRRFGGWGPR